MFEDLQVGDVITPLSYDFPFTIETINHEKHEYTLVGFDKDDQLLRVSCSQEPDAPFDYVRSSDGTWKVLWRKS